MAVAVAAAVRGPHRLTGLEKNDRGNTSAMMTPSSLAALVMMSQQCVVQSSVFVCVCVRLKVYDEGSKISRHCSAGVVSL